VTERRTVMSEWDCERVGCQYPVLLESLGEEQCGNCGNPVEWLLTWADCSTWMLCAEHMKKMEEAADE